MECQITSFLFNRKERVIINEESIINSQSALEMKEERGRARRTTAFVFLAENIVSCPILAEKNNG